MKIFISCLLLAVTVSGFPRDGEIQPRDVEMEPRVTTSCGCAKSPFGTQNSDRIVGGGQVLEHTFPWQVKLPGCGGTIVNQKFVVSAMHCFPNKDVNNPGFSIIAGMHNKCSSSETTRQERKVVKIHTPPGGYNAKTMDNDIGILELESPLQLGTGVQPAKLPTTDTNEGELNIVSGWGTLKSGGPSPCFMRYVEQKALSTEKCRNTAAGKAYKSQNGKELPSSQLCSTITGGGKDSCQGDSGGPLVRIGKDKCMELVGVVSWGYGCALADNPGIYTRVYDYVNWINSIIEPGKCSSTPNLPDPKGINKFPASDNPKKCENPKWVGDKYCDDLTNTKECNWDGGDCCNNTSPTWKDYCKDCACLATPNQPTTTTTTSTVKPCVKPDYIGDKYCDDITNTKECNWDGGDCCNNTAQNWNVYCTECKCKSSA